MDENKKLENEIIEEATQEATEEAVEEAVNGTAEEAAEESAQDTDESQEEVVLTEEIPEEIKKGSKTGAIIAVAVALVIVVAAVVTSTLDFNKYNKMGYVDISGKTIQDIADAQGVTLSEFLETYELPSDMPGNTTEAAAYYTIPAGIIAEMNGLDFETLKAMLKLPDDVTEDTPWGEAEGGILLADYIGGEDKVEAFKEQYGFGDEVTSETTWGEIRNQVDTVTKEKNEAKAAAEEDELEDEDVE